jgi:WD40 repeat protein
VIVLELTRGSADRVRFAPTGPLLAVGHANNWVEVWDADAQTPVAGFYHNAPKGTPGFRFHPARPVLVYSETFLQVNTFDPAVPESDVLLGNTGNAEDVLLTRDETRLLVVNRTFRDFRLFDLTAGPDAPPVWAAPVYSRTGHPARTHAEFLPGEEWFAVAEDHKNSRTRLSVRSVATGDILCTEKLPYQTTAGLAVAPDGLAVAVVTGPALLLYDAPQLHRYPSSPRWSGKKHLTGVAYHPSGRYLAVTGNDETVRLHDAATLREVRAYTWDIGRVRSVCFSPDGTLAAAGSDDGKVVVWDVDV